MKPHTRTALVGAAVATSLAVLLPTPGAQAARPTAVPATLVPVGATYAPPVPGVRRFLVRSQVRQVIVVSARTWRSTSGTVTAWVRSGTGWRRVAVLPARLGYAGLVPAAARRQSSGTTPAGSFRITETFGRLADPGTAMPYTRVTDDHWWVQDRRSRYYNQMRRGSQGGFARTTRGYNGSERLARMGHQYDYAAVVDFNRPRPVVGRGSGIFLHAYGDRTTVGCVSVPGAQMRALLRWLDPAASPRIIIGEDGWLAGHR